MKYTLVIHCEGDEETQAHDVVSAAFTSPHDLVAVALCVEKLADTVERGVEHHKRLGGRSGVYAGIVSKEPGGKEIVTELRADTESKPS